MKSYHFSLLTAPVTIIWPWLYSLKYFRDLDVIVIYPFAFVPSVNSKIIISNRTNLDGMIARILLKQQEEILQVSVILCIVSTLIHGFAVWRFLPLLLFPTLYLIDLLSRIEHFKIVFPTLVRVQTNAYLYLFASSGFFAEAYANCNYPDYLRVRKVFAWWKYFMKG